jgi:hypothetical protein
MNEQELTKQAMESPEFKDVVKELGLEAAEDLIAFKSLCLVRFQRRLNDLSMQLGVEFIKVMPDKFDETVVFPKLDQTIVNSFIYGAMTYRSWLEHHDIDILGIEDKIKKERKA